jgi:hypothetical protein
VALKKPIIAAQGRVHCLPDFILDNVQRFSLTGAVSSRRAFARSSVRRAAKRKTLYSVPQPIDIKSQFTRK